MDIKKNRKEKKNAVIITSEISKDESLRQYAVSKSARKE